MGTTPDWYSGIRYRPVIAATAGDLNAVHVARQDQVQNASHRGGGGAGKSASRRFNYPAEQKTRPRHPYARRRDDADAGEKRVLLPDRQRQSASGYGRRKTVTRPASALRMSNCRHHPILVSCVYHHVADFQLNIRHLRDLLNLNP